MQKVVEDKTEMVTLFLLKTHLRQMKKERDTIHENNTGVK